MPLIGTSEETCRTPVNLTGTGPGLCSVAGWRTPLLATSSDRDPLDHNAQAPFTVVLNWAAALKRCEFPASMRAAR